MACKLTDQTCFMRLACMQGTCWILCRLLLQLTGVYTFLACPRVQINVLSSDLTRSRWQPAAQSVRRRPASEVRPGREINRVAANYNMRASRITCGSSTCSRCKLQLGHVRRQQLPELVEQERFEVELQRGDRVGDLEVAQHFRVHDAEDADYRAVPVYSCLRCVARTSAAASSSCNLSLCTAMATCCQLWLMLIWHHADGTPRTAANSSSQVWMVGQLAHGHAQLRS